MWWVVCGCGWWGWVGVCVVFAVVGGGVGLVVGCCWGGVLWCRVGGVEMRLRLVELFVVSRLGDDAVLDVVVEELVGLERGELVALIGALVGVGSAMLDVIEVSTGVPAQQFLQQLALDQDLP